MAGTIKRAMVDVRRVGERTVLPTVKRVPVVQALQKQERLHERQD